MTYFWFCVSAWLALNAAVVLSLIGHYREEQRAAKRREIFYSRGAR